MTELNDDAIVKLQSSDGIMVTVPCILAKQSGTVKNMLEDLGIASVQFPIPLPMVDGATLKLIVEYCNSRDVDFFISKVAKDKDHLLKLLAAANFLDMKPLLDLGCIYTARLIYGMTAEEMRIFFHMEDDFGEEEKQQMEKEKAWHEPDDERRRLRRLR
jgi:hypothetical protein